MEQIQQGAINSQICEINDPNESIIQQEEVEIRSQYEEKVQNIETQKIQLKETAEPVAQAQENFENEFIPTLGAETKRRLHIIFEYYSHKQAFSVGSPTFEQIKHKLNIVNLNKWMLFCKDFQLSKLMSTMSLHNLFKRYSVHNQLDFNQFQQIMLRVMSSDGNYDRTLQLLGIDSQKSWKQKVLQLDIPYKPTKKTEHILKVSSLNKKLFKTRVNNQNQRTPKLQDSKISARKQIPNRFTFEDIRNMVLPISINIEADDDDRTYLNEFRIDFRKVPQNRSRKVLSQSIATEITRQPIKSEFTFNPKMHNRHPTHHNEYTINSKNSREDDQNCLRAGLFKRLDDRLRKFSRKH